MTEVYHQPLVLQGLGLASLGTLPATEHCFHPGHHLTDGERLLHVVVSSQSETVEHIFLRVLRRQEDDGDRGSGLVAFQLTGQFKARHPRHHHVEQKQVIVRHPLLYRHLSRICHLCLIARSRQVIAKDLTQIMLVVNYKDSLLFHSGCKYNKKLRKRKAFISQILPARH